MRMHGDLSPEARERAGRTVEVAAVFAEHAERIVAQLPEVPEGHVLVAVVTTVDGTHELTATHHVEQGELVMRVPELEQTGGWVMVFSPGSSVADVRRRADEMADLARRRAAAIDRIVARRGE